MEFKEWKRFPLKPQSDFKIIDERDPKETKVVLGMTGGVDSAAAAFLLKKQGFQVIGVALVFINEEEIVRQVEKKRNDVLDKDYTKMSLGRPRGRVKTTKEEDTRFLQGNCSIKDLDLAKRICDHLDIPFYAVNATPEFDYFILDPLVAGRLAGENFLPCAGCNNVKMEILLRKAHMLKADFVATGHYAKVHRGETGKFFHLFKSNDQENDQSYLLSRLQQYHLARMVFPLADIRRTEVLKIVERFQLGAKIQRDSRRPCFISYGSLSMFVEGRSHDKLRPPGAFVEKKTGLQLGEHYGIHLFKIGEKNIEGRQTKVNLMTIGGDMNVISIEPTGRIYLGPDEEFEFSGCGVTHLNISVTLDLGRPLDVYIKAGINEKKVAAILFLKNNFNATLEFSRKVYGLGKGQHLTFYSSDRIGSKILGSGIVSFLGDMNILNRTKALDMVMTDDKGNVIEKKISPLRF